MLYRGRIAPSPTGYLHLGHAATFFVAWQRAREAHGKLVLRIEDIDPQRCRPEFSSGTIEDLHWLGLDWDEGPKPDGKSTGSFAPYEQSQRMNFYLEAWQALLQKGFIFPCSRSRKDMQDAPRAPHGGEAIYPQEWRPTPGPWQDVRQPGETHWRFRIPNGRKVSFIDARCGQFSAVAGRDFGDFPIWRRDGVPAYELAVVVDDAAMQITEVVRGEDLLLSTCRQILLYEALDLVIPAFYHTRLWLDETGERLAKRSQSLSLRAMRQQGKSVGEIHSLLQGLPRTETW